MVREVSYDSGAPRVNTNGSYLRHPTTVATARLLKFAGRNATLFFNYRSNYTTLWNNAGWRSTYGYTALYPKRSENGTLVVML